MNEFPISTKYVDEDVIGKYFLFIERKSILDVNYKNTSLDNSVLFKVLGMDDYYNKGKEERMPLYNIQIVAVSNTNYEFFIEFSASEDRLNGNRSAADLIRGTIRVGAPFTIHTYTYWKEIHPEDVKKQGVLMQL